MTIPRFTATIVLKGNEKPVKFQQRFGYFKVAYRWVMQWHRKTVVTSAEILDLDRTEKAWNSTEGLLLKYRTVKPEEALPFLRPTTKPNYVGKVLTPYKRTGFIGRSPKPKPSKPDYGTRAGIIGRSQIAS